MTKRRALSQLTIRAACSLARMRVGLVRAGRDCYRVRIFEPRQTLIGGPLRLPTAKESQRRQRVRLALLQLGWSSDDARRVGDSYRSANGLKWERAVSEQIERRALADPTADGRQVPPSAVRSAPNAKPQPTEIDYAYDHE